MKIGESVLLKGQIEVTVWWENTSDELFSFTNSYGFGLDTLKQIYDNWNQNDEFKGHYGKILIVIPRYEQAQIGNYPPPNIEAEEYWDYEIISKDFIFVPEREDNDD